MKSPEGKPCEAKSTVVNFTTSWLIQQYYELKYCFAQGGNTQENKYIEQTAGDMRRCLQTSCYFTWMCLQMGIRLRVLQPQQWEKSSPKTIKTTHHRKQIYTSKIIKIPINMQKTKQKNKRSSSTWRFCWSLSLFFCLRFFFKKSSCFGGRPPLPPATPPKSASKTSLDSIDCWGLMIWIWSCETDGWNQARRSPVDIGSWPSHCLQVFFYIQGGWEWDFWTINSILAPWTTIVGGCWWLNQPIWKLRASQIGSFPQV